MSFNSTIRQLSSNEKFYEDRNLNEGKATKKIDENVLQISLTTSTPFVSNTNTSQNNSNFFFQASIDTEPNSINFFADKIINKLNNNESNFKDSLKKIQSFKFDAVHSEELNIIIEQAINHSGARKKIDTLLLLLIESPTQKIRDLAYYCIKAGANVDQSNYDGVTLLQIAAAYGDYDLIKKLISTNSNILSNKKREDLSARDLAYLSGFYECALLLDYSMWKYNYPTNALDIIDSYLGKIEIDELTKFLRKLDIKNIPSKKLIKCFSHKLTKEQNDTENLFLSLYDEIFKNETDCFRKTWLAQTLSNEKFTDISTIHLLEKLNQSSYASSIILESGELFFVKFCKMIQQKKLICLETHLEKKFTCKIEDLFENTNYKELSQNLQEFVDANNLKSSSEIYQKLEKTFSTINKNPYQSLFSQIRKNFFRRFEPTILDIKAYEKVHSEMEAGEGITDCPRKVYNYILDELIKNNRWDSIAKLQTKEQILNKTCPETFDFHDCPPTIILQTEKGPYVVNIQRLLHIHGIAERLGLSKAEIEEAASRGKLQELLQIQLELEKKISLQYEKILTVYGNSKNMKEATTIGPNTLLKAIRIAIHHFEKERNKNSQNPFVFKNKHLFYAIDNNETLELTVLQAKEVLEKLKKGKFKKGVLGTWGAGTFGLVSKAIRLETGKLMAFKSNRDYLEKNLDSEKTEHMQKKSIKHLRKGHEILEYIHEMNPVKDKPLTGIQPKPYHLIELNLPDTPPIIGLLGEAYSSDWSNCTNLSLVKKLKSIHDLWEAVAFLADNDMAHADIKPQNILIKEEDGEVKTALTDLDGAIRFKYPRNRCFSIHTRSHVSARILKTAREDWKMNEIQKSNESIKKIDVYAAGLSSHELLFKRDHSFNLNKKGYVRQINTDDFDDESTLEKKALKPLISFLKKILTCKPAKMMSAQKALEAYKIILPSMIMELEDAKNKKK